MTTAGWIEPDKYNEICGLIPIPSVDVAVFNRDGKLLLLKRQMPPIKGTWCLPGGGIRLGETPYETAMRELLEETGIASRDFIQCEGIVTYFFGHKQNVAVGMATKILYDADIVMDGEHEDYGWFDIFDLPEPIDKVMQAQIKNCICAYHEKGWLLD